MTIHFFGVIGSDIVAADFSRQLAAAKGAPIILEVDSPGGSVTSGLAMHNALKNYPGKKTAHIVGLCASMAPAVIAACDHIIVEAASSVMVHFPSTITQGTAADHEKTAATLRGFGELMVSIFATRTRRTKEEIRVMLANESYFFGADAVAAGFADQVTGTTTTARASGIATARAQFQAFDARQRLLGKADDIEQIAAILTASGDTVSLTEPQNMTEFRAARKEKHVAALGFNNLAASSVAASAASSVASPDDSSDISSWRAARKAKHVAALGFNRIK